MVILLSRLFKVSLKLILLHNGNIFPVLLFRVVDMTETYQNMSTILILINYIEYSWQICSDLKEIAVLVECKKATPNSIVLCVWEFLQEYTLCQISVKYNCDPVERSSALFVYKIGITETVFERTE